MRGKDDNGSTNDVALVLWILVVMLGILHEYSEALSLRERWMLKDILEGNRGQGSNVYSALNQLPPSAKLL